jgi:hypothetical protein
MTGKLHRTRRTDRAPLRRKTRLFLEHLEDRTVPANGQWTAWFAGLAPAADFATQANSGQRLLQLGAVPTQDVSIVRAQDLSGAFIVQTSLSTTHQQLTAWLSTVPGFIWAQDYTEPQPQDIEKVLGRVQRILNVNGPFDYDDFLSREKNGLIPNETGPVANPPERTDVLVNNNGGAGTTSLFTQSETSVIAFGNNVVIGFNDSGSNAGGTNKFTGWSYSSDGGLTFTDGGTLPTNAGGDAGDPVLARDNTTGRIYYATLGFSVSTIQVFRSDDNGVTWSAPVNGTPGGSSEDKQWMVVDNNPGAGNGNVYLMSRNFGGGAGIYVYRSTDGGATFGPSGGTLIVNGMQGAYITVGPDHSVYAFWYQGTNGTIQMRKSTDFGVTFGAPVTVVSGLVGGVNGDMGLTGIRQGTATAAGFRSNQFPHATVNPVTGNVYVTFANDGTGADKADVFLTQSTDGGATWGAPVKVNDDATTTDQWMPTLAVTPDGSRLGVFYYSRQEDAANNNLFKYYGRVGIVSGPGITFLPSFAVSDVASLPEFGRDSLIVGTYMGDYDSTAATPGAFHVVWSDNRDDLPGGAPRKDPNVYYKRINLGLAVASTVPAQGSIINSQPTSFTVNLTDPVQPATVQATDFLVNGIPADSFSYTPGSTTIAFNYSSSPVTAQGLQTMHMDAGALLRDPDGDPLLQFDGTFRYDVTTLTVTSTNPPFPGGVFTLPPPLTYDVTFNEPIDPASVQTGDLLLSGIPGAIVTGAVVQPGNTTIRFTLNGLASEGILTATINSGAVTDVFGNPGATFTANYEVDFGNAVPYPTPLAAKNPPGSLIFDPVVVGRVNFAGDTDGFTLNINAGQRITVLLRATEASLQPSIEVRDPSNVLIGTATAGAAGQNVLLQGVPAGANGVYTFTVSGAGGTIGNYSVQIVLNANLEAEGVLTGDNNTTGNAQNIDSSFLTLQTSLATATRGAVMGTTDLLAYSASAIPFAFEDVSQPGNNIAGLTNQDDTAVSIPIGFTFPMFGTNYTSVFVSSNGLMTFVSGNTSFGNTDLTTAPTQATISPFWDDLHTGGGGFLSGVYAAVSGSGSNQHLTVQWMQVRFFSGGTAGDTITFQAQLFADGRVQFNYLDLVSGTAAGNNGGSATVGIKHLGTQGPDRVLLAFNNGPNAFVGTGQSSLLTPPAALADFMSMTLGGGETVTIASRTQDGSTNLNVELRDSSNALLATATPGPTNLTNVITNFVVPSSGTYYLRVNSTNSNVPYTTVVTRNADFDTEANDDFATAQNLNGTHGVLGAIGVTSSYSAAAVPFAFEDISATGTIIGALTNQDDLAASIPIGFTFPFYGVNNSSVFVSSNGLLTFAAGNSGFTNTDLTSTPAQASIAPFWDDLHTGGGAAGSNVFSQVTGSGLDQHLTIQWNQVRFFSGGTAGDTITFQAQLYADGRIRFNYLDLVSGSAAGNNGASTTVGIKASGVQGPDRLLLAFNNGPNTFVGTGQSTLITLATAEDWYKVTISSINQQLILQTATPGAGPGAPGNSLDPHIELYDPNGILVQRGSREADGMNETIKLRRATLLGDYRIKVSSDNGTLGDYFLGMTLITPAAAPRPSAFAPPDGGRAPIDGSLSSALIQPPSSGGTFTASPMIVDAPKPEPLPLIDFKGVANSRPAVQNPELASFLVDQASQSQKSPSIATDALFTSGTLVRSRL